MISRLRLHQANRHARRRWRAVYRGERRLDLAWPWQHYRKLTAACSSWCCGNPRRHYGQVTRQERQEQERWMASHS